MSIIMVMLDDDLTVSPTGIKQMVNKTDSILDADAEQVSL